jgi:transcriptional regulator GlxA family with amidase domain
MSDFGRRESVLPLWQVKRVVDFIEANMHQPVHTGDLAALVNFSKCYFSILFRRAIGESPLAYVRRRRIERAQKMMLASDMPLCEVALACGLADQPHLSRLFRRLVGSTPGVWRRAQRAASIEAVNASTRDALAAPCQRARGAHSRIQY